jgi:FKBP-type peptidyl-prolyl cis-trans isomerase SlyD
MVVGLAYRLTLDDNSEIDAAPSTDPLMYLHGQGNIINGLEDELDGMKVGETKEVVVDPADAYGDFDDEGFIRVPVDAFPSDLDLTEGLALMLNNRDTGDTIEAYVSEIGEKEVLMDLNHPLAGQTLHFDVEIISIRHATSEELDHGHVHDGSHAH